MEVYFPRATTRVVYGKNLKRVTLQRALVSLFAHYPEEVSYKHLLLLFDNMIWLEEKCHKDPSFKSKFGITLKVLAYILKNMNFSAHKISKSQIQNLSRSFQRNLKHFSLDKRNTKQPLSQMWKRVEVRPTQSLGVPKKNLPPERYIGIGYRDKGTAKKPWLNGNHSWQEIASVPLEKLYENNY